MEPSAAIRLMPAPTFRAFRREEVTVLENFMVLFPSRAKEIEFRCTRLP